jgi:hypothetical protein
LSAFCLHFRLFNNLVPPSQLPAGSNYHLFKGDVRPEWEDQYNEKGWWTLNKTALHHLIPIPRKERAGLQGQSLDTLCDLDRVMELHGKLTWPNRFVGGPPPHYHPKD